MVAQQHNKFKIFVTPAPAGPIPSDVLADVGNFIKEAEIAAKSIGVEYLEREKKVVLSIGYRDDEPGYPVTVRCVALGKQALDPRTLENAFETAALVVPNVICHEFYVNEDDEFFLVLMAQA